MRNVAFIPVRGGGKSIPKKNIREICGKQMMPDSLRHQTTMYLKDQEGRILKAI